MQMLHRPEVRWLFNAEPYLPFQFGVRFDVHSYDLMGS
jgi:hypothetical protein